LHSKLALPGSAAPNLYILQLNRFLYILNQASDEMVKSEGKMRVLRKYEFDGTVKFDIFDTSKLNAQQKSQEMIAIMHEQDKLVNFYDIEHFLLNSSDGALSET